VVSLGSARRGDFLLEADMAFCNHGSFGATPRVVQDEARRWRERMEAQPLRFMLHELPPALDAAIATLATFVGAPAEHLCFVDNATSGVNAVVRSLPLERGDRVVTTTHVYGAVRNALQFVCSRVGASLFEVPIPFPSGGADEVVEALDAALRASDALLVVDQITSPTGLVLPIERLVALARDRGVPVLVDGAHAPGQLDLDLAALGADWWTGNLHKWALAPKSAALLYARPERWETLRSHVISHVVEGPAAFHWPGTRDFSPWLAAPAGLAYLEELGLERVRAYGRELVLEAGHHLCGAWGVSRPQPDELVGQMLTLPLPTDLPATVEVADRLHDRLWRDHRVEAPVHPFGDRLWTRISGQVYNTKVDYEELGTAVLELVNHPTKEP